MLYLPPKKGETREARGRNAGILEMWLITGFF